MVRPPLSTEERERGTRLGEVLRAARGDRTSVEIAARAGISVEALRKIEHGRVPTPAFFTVLAIAEAVGLSLDELRLAVTPSLLTALPPARSAW
jgi:transcriptional regulator with XRE-family HTH domain